MIEGSAMDKRANRFLQAASGKREWGVFQHLANGTMNAHPAQCPVTNSFIPSFDHYQHTISVLSLTIHPAIHPSPSYHGSIQTIEGTIIQSSDSNINR
jgi:hypothetical protein